MGTLTFQFSRAVGISWNGWLALCVRNPPAAKQPAMKAPANTPTRMARSHSGRDGSRPAPKKSSAESATANSAVSRQIARNHQQLKAPARQTSSRGTIVDLVRRMRFPLTCGFSGAAGVRWNNLLGQYVSVHRRTLQDIPVHSLSASDRHFPQKEARALSSVQPDDFGAKGNPTQGWHRKALGNMSEQVRAELRQERSPIQVRLGTCTVFVPPHLDPPAKFV